MRSGNVAFALSMFAVSALAGCAHNGNIAVPVGATPLTSALAARTYTSVPLPNGFIPYAMMSDGQIPGALGDRAAIYKNGGTHLLARYANCVSGSIATSVNSRGEAVGFCLGNGVYFALDFHDGRVNALHRPAGRPPTNSWVEALSIDDARDVIGFATCTCTNGPPNLARFFTDGKPATLIADNLPRSFGVPYNLNRSGHFAYSAYRGQFTTDGANAYVGYGDQLTRVFPDRGGNSSATWLNDANSVTGWINHGSFNAPVLQAYLHTSTGTALIPFLPETTSMVPTAVDNQNQVIGNASLNNGANAVFIYASGHVTNLGPFIKPSGPYTALSGISDRGAFVAHDNNRNFFLIAPVGN